MSATTAEARLTPPKAEFAFGGLGYALPEYPFRTPPELAGGAPRRYPVVVVGAGLAGLTAACAFAELGIEAVVLDEDNTVGVRGASSRGICYAQKTLEICARMGLYERLREKGIQWSVGRTLAGEDEVYSFDLSRQPGLNASAQPPFINIQQYYIEWFLAEQTQALGHVDLRWKSRVTGIEQDAACVRLKVETPEGPYTLEASWVVDCTGLHSPLRKALDRPMFSAKGMDRWCISDVRFKKQPPTERWTWVEAPFNENRAVWQHLMADGVWRLDFQMEPDADMAEMSREEVVRERLRRQFGDEVEYELIWVGPYAYRSQCMEDFRHGRVFFAGDAAHLMSPFGARGGNSGVQDADNLAWKLAMVLRGQAGEALLDSYTAERRPAALENIRITDRTMRFLRPHSPVERVFRDAVLGLAREHAFARALVNTGRMSVANRYLQSPCIAGPGAGVSIQNLVLQGGKDLAGLVHEAGGRLLVIAEAGAALTSLEARYPVRVVDARTLGTAGWAALRAQTACPQGSAVVVRPDLYCGGIVAAEPAAVERGLRRLLALEEKVTA